MIMQEPGLVEVLETVQDPHAHRLHRHISSAIVISTITLTPGYRERTGLWRPCSTQAAKLQGEAQTCGD